MILCELGSSVPICYSINWLISQDHFHRHIMVIKKMLKIPQKSIRSFDIFRRNLLSDPLYSLLPLLSFFLFLFFLILSTWSFSVLKSHNTDYYGVKPKF